MSKSSSEKRDFRKFLKMPLIALCLVLLSVAWLWFGEGGFARLWRSETERRACIERIHRLAKENQALLDEVKLLRNDMKYLESVARRKLNLVRENEVIYRFNREKTHERGGHGSTVVGNK